MLILRPTPVELGLDTRSTTPSPVLLGLCYWSVVVLPYLDSGAWWSRQPCLPGYLLVALLPAARLQQHAAALCLGPVCATPPLIGGMQQANTPSWCRHAWVCDSTSGQEAYMRALPKELKESDVASLGPSGAPRWQQTSTQAGRSPTHLAHPGRSFTHSRSPTQTRSRRHQLTRPLLYQVGSRR